MTGMILYIPSNVLPVMTMRIVGTVEPLTVFGGIRELYDSGLPLIAGVVFLASIMVPFLKLVCLGWILFMHGKPVNMKRRTTMLKIVQTIGSWSMVDIFLLSVLAAVGQLGALASVEAKPGALFFATVVLCSLFAAEIYKPRLIWRSAALAKP